MVMQVGTKGSRKHIRILVRTRCLSHLLSRPRAQPSRSPSAITRSISACISASPIERYTAYCTETHPRPAVRGLLRRMRERCTGGGRAPTCRSHARGLGPSAPRAQRWHHGSCTTGRAAASRVVVLGSDAHKAR